MGMADQMTAAVLGGATTMVARRVTRSALHDTFGEPRLPARMRHQRGLGTMLLWAAAAGIILALADVLMEQRGRSET
jgi:hypothetical protein